MKRLTALFLSAMLMLSLVGCAVDQTPTQPSADPTTGTTVTPAEPTFPADWVTMGRVYFNHGYPEYSSLGSDDLAKQNDEDITVLRLACYADGGDLADYLVGYHELAILELNQMLEDRDLPYRVEIWAVHNNKPIDTMRYLGGTKSFDIICGDFTTEQILEHFMPITDYASGSAEPSLESAVVHDFNWISSTVDGEIYGICTQPSRSYGHGWQVDTAFMTNNNLTTEDFSKSFREMDDLFAELYEANGNEPFLYYDGDGSYVSGQRNTDPRRPVTAYTPDVENSIATALPMGGICDAVLYDSFQPIGACFAIDFTAEKPTVVNMLETERVRNIQQAYARYREAGYTTIDESQRKVSYTQVFSSGSYVYGNYTYIPVTDTLIKSGSGQNMLGIAKSTEHKEEALSFLKLIAEDEEIRWQLCYGKEGRDYKFTNNGFMNMEYKEEYYNEKHDVNDVRLLGFHNFDMLSPLNYFYGVPTENYASTPRAMYHSRDGMTALETYYEDMENLDHCFYPIQFDYSAFTEFTEGKELLSIGKVMGNYYYMFTTPDMTEEMYDQMLQDMKNAGSDKIIVELQRQLDAWLAEHPDWNPLG